MMRGLDPKMSSPAAAFMNDIILGAEKYNSGDAKTVPGIKATNASTLVLKLTQPAPDLIARLSMPFFSATDLSVPIDPAGVNTYPWPVRTTSPHGRRTVR